jgi:hypothetical protein
MRYGLTICFLIMLCSTLVTAAELHVPSEYSTIEEAMAAGSGHSDTVVVAPGTYSGPGFTNLVWHGEVDAIVSSGGPLVTVIELDGNRFMQHPPDINGITFRNGGTAVEGYALFINNCRFEGNRMAARCTYDVFVIRDCWFLFNDTCVWVEEPIYALLYKCVFLGNKAVIDVTFDIVSIAGQCIFAYNDEIGVNEANTSLFWSVLYHNVRVERVYGARCNVLWNDSLARIIAGGDTLIPPDDDMTLADPGFCDTTLLLSTDVMDNSILLMENSGCDETIGNVEVGCSCCEGKRGNADWITGPGGEIDVSDITYLVTHLFDIGEAPPCPTEGNVDGIEGPAGPIDVGDLSYLVAYLFGDGPVPPPCPAL